MTGVLHMNDDELEYVGFWVRVAASVIDSLLIMLVIVPLLLAVYGQAYLHSETIIAGPADFLISWVLPAVVVVALWLKWQATPGKAMFGARIVDARTGKTPTPGQLVIRYLGYFVSGIPFGLGLVWVAFDPRKQGWHDKMAGTVVVRRKRRDAGVSFERD